MTFDKPKRPNERPQTPGTSQKSNPATQKPVTKKVIPAVGGSGGGSGGNRGGTGNNGGGGGNAEEPSPWLLGSRPEKIAPAASFVEYLRWMRSPDSPYKDPTKVQIMQLAEEGAYNEQLNERLKQLNHRTQLMAGNGNCFRVGCPWRIRVGGHRGPESILLPAFDALGMPYIPSSTLRGVARAAAMRELGNEGEVNKFFGSLSGDNCDRMGKVIFLDAYPVPDKSSPAGGLAVDMANNIWSWKGNQLEYSPNPNPFFSLKEPVFLVGIRPVNPSNTELAKRFHTWLVDGLRVGTGSQINSGYGILLKAGETSSAGEFFRVEFSLEGQLIHGRQKFTQWEWNDRRQDWQMRGQAQAEVRPIAFKSMLRYWFRAFALGMLPSERVQHWEAQLFGSLTIEGSGWVRFGILEGEVVQVEPRPNIKGKDDRCGEQAGILTLSFGTEAPSANYSQIETLCKNLTWMMFHLGGIGQGARRPCYSRKTRDRAPWYRGSTLIPESQDVFWDLPETPKAFQKLFRQRLQDFSQALRQLCGGNVGQPDRATPSSRSNWTEAVDANCKIIVCSGDEDYGKPFALAVLHSRDLKVKDKRGEDVYDGDLCGVVGREVKPSPVWIADLGDYQVVTVFGATQDPRKRFTDRLCREANNSIIAFPL